MREKSTAIVLTTLAVLLFSGATARAQTFTTLYKFTGGSDGANSYPGVIQDPAGNLYGTTNEGGDLNCDPSRGCGTVYQLNAAGKETVLHSFSWPDGIYPYTPMARDSQGNLYGTTVSGGSADYGTVFRIGTAGHETVLYTFTGGSDGCNPWQGLVRDKAGNLYGSTASGDCSGYGTIFKIDKAGRFTVLHRFAGFPSDGGGPYYGHLAMDKSGNLYGLTEKGGAYDSGALYKLSKSGALTLLHSFAGGTRDGCSPWGSVVVQARSGNLYGTTSQCGSNNAGTIWKVSQKGKETILHNFANSPSDGCLPFAGVAPDPKGNLYGVTSGCGAHLYYGALYKLSASGRLTLLHSFDSSDGSSPLGEVLRSTKGTLFGTTVQGGSGCTYGCGTVWSYVP